MMLWDYGICPVTRAVGCASVAPLLRAGFALVEHVSEQDGDEGLRGGKYQQVGDERVSEGQDGLGPASVPRFQQIAGSLLGCFGRRHGRMLGAVCKAKISSDTQIVDGLFRAALRGVAPRVRLQLESSLLP